MSFSWDNGDDGLSQQASSGSTCQLSPSASAFSAMLSAFIGSVINGLASGWLVAFVTGWIAWMALARVFLSGSYMLYRSATNSWGPGRSDAVLDPIAPLDSFDASQNEEAAAYLMDYNPSSAIFLQPARPQTTKRALSGRGLLTAIWPPADVVRGLDQPGQNQAHWKTWSDLNFDVSSLGWFSWFYTAIFAPVTQVIWVTANASNHNIGPAKIVKGLTTAVTALPLCIDCKARYGDSLGRGRYVFNWTTSISCLLQGVLGAFLLAQGVADTSAQSFGFPWPIVGIYPIFSLFWMIGSFLVVPMRDGGRKRAGQAHWAGYLLDVGVGAFAGVFLAAPAFALYMNAQFDRQVTGQGGGDGISDLGAYLRCETQLWKKFAAVSP